MRREGEREGGKEGGKLDGREGLTMFRYKISSSGHIRVRALAMIEHRQNAGSSHKDQEEGGEIATRAPQPTNSDWRRAPRDLFQVCEASVVVLRTPPQQHFINLHHYFFTHTIKTGLKAINRGPIAQKIGPTSGCDESQLGVWEGGRRIFDALQQRWSFRFVFVLSANVTLTNRPEISNCGHVTFPESCPSF
eukprot:506690-Rhodomonas_salina.2